MTCDQAARLVARAGGIVLDTSATTFDRYVSDLRFCMPQQALRPAFEPTRDNPQCFIGYTCYDPAKGDWRWGWGWWAARWQQAAAEPMLDRSPETAANATRGRAERGCGS